MALNQFDKNGVGEFLGEIGEVHARDVGMVKFGEMFVPEFDLNVDSSMIFDLDSDLEPAPEPETAPLEEGEMLAEMMEEVIPAQEPTPATKLVKTYEMGQIHEHILDALIDGNDSWESKSILELSKRLRTTVDELQMLMDMVDPGKVNLRRFEKLVERESISMSGYNWGKVEASALGKIGELLQGNRITDAAQLLRIAQAANAAYRRGPNGQVIPNTPGGAPVSVSIYNQNNANGVNPDLPGEGSLGTVTLTLTNRTVKQLSKDRIIDGNSERLLDRAEMLNEDDIKDLGKMLDGRDAG